MKSFKYIAFSLGLAAMSFASCTDSFLDKVPDERTDIDNETKVIQLLISSYPDCNPSWICELYSDNLIDNQAPHLPSSPRDKQILSHYNFSHYSLWDNQAFQFQPATQATYSDYDSPGSLWGGYYQSVAQVNEALQAIEKINTRGGLTKELKAARGEAELLRAYDHFMLVNIFSKAYRGAESKNDVGVPYVTEIENVVNKQYDRGNVADVYAKIQADLEAGLADISDVNFQVAPKYHFNQEAAHAFAARFYLFSHQWEKVIEHADAVLGTDDNTLSKKIMDLSIFKECASMDDYSTQWQKPELANNLMLVTTGSLLERRVFGYRYSLAGPSVASVLMYHTSPLHNYYVSPLAIVNGSLFSSSSNDYGFISCKIGEKFEYSDKIAGIGYPHIVYRAFTCNELLLERAEAKIMLGRLQEAGEDLMAYWNLEMESMDPADFKVYVNDWKNTKRLTPELIQSVFGHAHEASYPNNVDDWSFTQTMGINVSEEARPYMNCLNEFRRFENAFEGMRFFDLKRWGMPYQHEVGIDSEIFKSEALDDTRAVEVPWEAISAGMSSSRGQVKPSATRATLVMDKSKFIK